MNHWTEIVAATGKVNPTVAALVSGGVDSAVMVQQLVAHGIRPHLFYIQIGMDADGYEDCTSEEDIALTQLLAQRYQLPFDVVSLHDEYWERVVSYTLDTVRRGLTPNPDVMCNKLIKFGVFEERYGYQYDFISTGHYATSSLVGGKVFLSTSPDPIKDQTDFLAQISFQQLSKILFPIGHMLKSEVRAIAQKEGLANAHRKDSQGICFLGKINYNEFIARHLGTKPGRIIEYETGKTLGTHQGFWFHTIGQRKGLGLSGGPWFVVKKDAKRNIILVSRGYDPATQYGREIWLNEINFITEDLFALEASLLNPEALSSLPISLKIRHTPEFIAATLEKCSKGGYYICSEEPIQGIAPGQYAVIYDPSHQLCLGSGMIVKGK